MNLLGLHIISFISKPSVGWNSQVDKLLLAAIAVSALMAITVSLGSICPPSTAISTADYETGRPVLEDPDVVTGQKEAAAVSEDEYPRNGL